MKRLQFLADALRMRLAQSRALMWLGLAGLALGAGCALAALARGIEIPPEGNLVDTATFDAALGFFMLTIAALAPGVHWAPRGRRRWTGALVGFTCYAYTIETVQAFRGLDPRFSRVAGPLDQAAGGIFFLVALAIMGCFGVLAAKYFRAPATSVAVAVRYGAAASGVAFAVGIWMSLATGGRFVPEAGNLLFVHAVGFHGLQAVPAVALLLRWADTAPSAAGRRVHVAGFAWVAACLALAWQSGSGRALAEWSPATLIACLGLMAFGVVAAVAAFDWLRVDTVAV